MNNGTRPLTEEEINQISLAMTSKRNQVLFELAIKTGFRISEMLSIKLQNLPSFNGEWDAITVFRRDVKGKTASRSVPLSESLKTALKAYTKSLPKGQTYLFESRLGNRLSRVQAWKIIKRAAKECGLSGKIACHSTRKTFAQNVYNKLDKDLVKLQFAMGHKNISSTVAYLSFDKEEVFNAIKSL